MECSLRERKGNHVHQQEEGRDAQFKQGGSKEMFIKEVKEWSLK